MVTLLFGGAWFNRNKDYDINTTKRTFLPVDGIFKKSDEITKKRPSQESLESPGSGWQSPLSSDFEVAPRRLRKVELLGWKKIVTTPNTLVFRDRFLSRVLQKFPFLAEAWYWALIYWVSPARCFAGNSIAQHAF